MNLILMNPSNEEWKWKWMFTIAYKISQLSDSLNFENTFAATVANCHIFSKFTLPNDVLNVPFG